MGKYLLNTMELVVWPNFEYIVNQESFLKNSRKICVTNIKILQTSSAWPRVCLSVSCLSWDNTQQKHSQSMNECVV